MVFDAPRLDRTLVYFSKASNYSTLATPSYTYVCIYQFEARPYIKRACHIDGNLTSNINKVYDDEGVGRFETLPSWRGAVLIG